MKKGIREKVPQDRGGGGLIGREKAIGVVRN